jgi:integrase/recombinase XerC
MSMLPAVDLYAKLLADARKPTTRYAREQDIADLARYLVLAGHLRIPDPSQACAYFLDGGAPRANDLVTEYARSRGDKERLDSKRAAAAATINRRISTFRRLVKLGRRNEVITWGIDVDSLTGVECLRDTSGPGTGGWVRILDVATKAAAETSKGKRDLAIIRLLHDNGLRRAEVASLELSDIDTDKARVFIVGKGRAAKTPMKLNPPTLLALVDWIDARGREPGALFVRMDRPKGEVARLDGNGIYKVVGQLGERAKLRERVRPHGIRHEAVTRVLELTKGDIVAAQAFARHKNPQTTMRYNDNKEDKAGKMSDLLGKDSPGSPR